MMEVETGMGLEGRMNTHIQEIESQFNTLIEKLEPLKCDYEDPGLDFLNRSILGCKTQVTNMLSEFEAEMTIPFALSIGQPSRFSNSQT